MQTLNSSGYLKDSGFASGVRVKERLACSGERLYQFFVLFGLGNLLYSLEFRGEIKYSFVILNNDSWNQKENKISMTGFLLFKSVKHTYKANIRRV